MRQIRPTAVVPRCVALALCLAACGREGDKDAGGDVPPIEPPGPVVGETSDDYSLRTSVPLATMGYDLKGLKSCLSTTSGSGLAELKASAVLDGEIGEWSVIEGLATDPHGDAPSVGDLTYIGIALQGEDLVVAYTPPAGGGAVYFEFGGIAPYKGVVTPEIRRLIRAEGGQLSEFTAGSFATVSSAMGRVTTTAGGVEALLSRRLLGDVVAYPLWWVRVFTRRGDDQSRLADSTAAVYFPSLIDTDDPKFVVTRCLDWNARPQAINLVQIRDARAKDRKFALEVAAARVQELARLGFDASVSTLGNAPVPTNTFTAVATANRVAPLKDKTGFGLDVDRQSAPYRALIVDARTLDPGSEQVFPQGPVVRRMAEKMLDMVLNRMRPDASSVEVSAWRSAIMDHVVRNTLGTGYWLDSYPDQVARAITVVPLAANQELTDNHAVGFAHLLSSHLLPAELIGAWSAAAAGDLAVLRQKTRDQADDAEKDALDRLWLGWMVPGPFARGSEPHALSDADSDGLPDHVESLKGTDPRLADTDGDGWSDFGEIVFGSDATASGSMPSRIMPDGEFGDWQRLIPKRLGIDRGKTGQCPKAADVEFFAAIANRDELVVGAAAHEYWESEPLARWEVEVDLPSLGKRLLVTGVSGSREYVVKDPTPPMKVLRKYRRAMPVARRTIEWALHRQALGLETYLDVPSTVQLRVRTLFNKDGVELLCDETSWFEPVISDR